MIDAPVSTRCRVPAGLGCQGPCDHIGDADWEESCWIVEPAMLAINDRPYPGMSGLVGALRPGAPGRSEGAKDDG
jgi:hypothetical protein